MSQETVPEVYLITKWTLILSKLDKVEGGGVISLVAREDRVKAFQGWGGGG